LSLSLSWLRKPDQKLPHERYLHRPRVRDRLRVVVRAGVMTKDEVRVRAKVRDKRQETR
jgi:hypothetical protein